MPDRLRDAYSRLAPCLIAADEVLSRAPGLEHVAGALEVVARRSDRATIGRPARRRRLRRPSPGGIE